MRPMKKEEENKTMSNKIFFFMVWVFLLFTLLYIPTKARAGDLMQWRPLTFAGGGAYASYGDLLDTARVIKHGPWALNAYYDYYYDYSSYYGDNCFNTTDSNNWSDFSAGGNASIDYGY
jgi:hypothetical protein